ncbi:hypothetical protein ACGF13_34985 [Kitasatospora sp. NPDC048286]|uniref:hypothetical protein n=1 Tax=unclassified Kitasatospora TaxID=2633591 RepID=UPI003713E12B
MGFVDGTENPVGGATTGFSSAASRRSATADRTPAAAVPTRTTSSRGNALQHRSHARPDPSSPALLPHPGAGRQLRRGLLVAGAGAAG